MTTTLQTQGDQILGYIMDFQSHGFFAPSGKVANIDKDKAEAHNKALANATWEAMLQAGRGVLYLTKDKHGCWQVSDWPGVHKLPTRGRASYSRHNWGIERTDVWFALDGSIWHGYNIGDNEILRVRRTKKAA